MNTFRRRFMMQKAKTEESIKPYMHIEALEDGLTVSLSRNAIEYSLDGSTWVTLPADTASPAINTGEKIYFKGELTPSTSYLNPGIGTFTLSKKCNAGGNAMSLLFGDAFENQYSLSGKRYAFYQLFDGCANLEGVSDDFLPATTLVLYCYYRTFSNTSIKIAPVLPSKTLVSCCYQEMFYGCDSLCYINAMFTTNPFPTSEYTSNWVSGVASTGTFVKNKDATWDATGTSGIPSGWTVVNDGDIITPTEQSYTIDLNSNWQQSTTISNPDSSLYDGVYESFSNKGVHSTAAIMYIDIVGYTDFSLYIRSYAESNYDYVMVSQLDQTINNSTSYSNTTLVKAHTRGSQTSGTAIGDYKLVEFTGIDGGGHRITILYRKNSYSSRGDDKGYLLIPKNQ